MGGEKREVRRACWERYGCRGGKERRKGGEMGWWGGEGNGEEIG
jgi:hypothetical protein